VCGPCPPGKKGKERKKCFPRRRPFKKEVGTIVMWKWEDKTYRGGGRPGGGKDRPSSAR